MGIVRCGHSDKGRLLKHLGERLAAPTEVGRELHQSICLTHEPGNGDSDSGDSMNSAQPRTQAVDDLRRDTHGLDRRRRLSKLVSHCVENPAAQADHSEIDYVDFGVHGKTDRRGARSDHGAGPSNLIG